MTKHKIGKRTVKNPSEYLCYVELLEKVPSDLSVEYETIPLDYTISYKYWPDFPIKYKKKSGVNCFIEYKGNGRAFSPQVRQKMIAIKKQYTEYKFYIVFHSDGIIGKKRKDGTYPRQSEWASKNGFDYCIGLGNIPKEWF